jgi:hypothetical protein
MCEDGWEALFSMRNLLKIPRLPEPLLEQIHPPRTTGRILTSRISITPTGVAVVSLIRMNAYQAARLFALELYPYAKVIVGTARWISLLQYGW